jgi:hypothetical protein
MVSKLQLGGVQRCNVSLFTLVSNKENILIFFTGLCWTPYHIAARNTPAPPALQPLTDRARHSKATLTGIHIAGRA